MFWSKYTYLLFGTMALRELWSHLEHQLILFYPWLVFSIHLQLLKFPFTLSNHLRVHRPTFLLPLGIPSCIFISLIFPIFKTWLNHCSLLLISAIIFKSLYSSLNSLFDFILHHSTIDAPCYLPLPCVRLDLIYFC